MLTKLKSKAKLAWNSQLCQNVVTGVVTALVVTTVITAVHYAANSAIGAISNLGDGGDDSIIEG